MNKAVKNLFNIINLIIGLFFATGIAFLDYKMVVIFGCLMILSVLFVKDLKLLMFIGEASMFFIFICKMSVAYNFTHQLQIGTSFQYIFQVFMLIISLFVFIYNIFAIKKEW